MNDKSLQDPLKALEEINEPDERQKNFIHGLEENHLELSAIVLNDSTPIEVQQLFETAKNLSLYSWFVYRFHQVSELIAFSALEMALRERYLAENSQSKTDGSPRGLYQLMQHAKKVEWITNDGFPSLYNRAKYLAEHGKLMDIIKKHDFEKDPSVLVGDPNEQEIEDALANLDMVKAVTNNTHKLRNNLAHGSGTLHPNSISTLITISEVINQIYS